MATLSEKILNLTLSNEKHSRDFESSIKDVQSQLDQVRLAKGQLEKQATTLQDLLYEREKIIKVGGTWAVWPVKSRQMSLKVAQMNFTKIALECGKFGQINCCLRIWKVWRLNNYDEEQ